MSGGIQRIAGRTNMSSHAKTLAPLSFFEKNHFIRMATFISPFGQGIQEWKWGKMRWNGAFCPSESQVEWMATQRGGTYYNELGKTAGMNSHAKGLIGVVAEAADSTCPDRDTE